MAADDRRPVLVCRLECPEDMTADVDGWMPKHFDDTLVDPHVLAAASYDVMRDYRPLAEGGLPAAFNGHGNRFIVYAADSLAGYQATLDSELARAAIADGAEREGRYPPLDGEAPFNGVMYAVRGVRGASRGPFAGRGPIVVERFDVPDTEADEFDAWLDGVHLDGAAAREGVVRARTWVAHRDYPRRFPFDRYRGKGDRMLWLELDEGVDLRAFLADLAADPWSSDSLRWDLRLPYVRREAASCLVLRTKTEALAARAALSVT